jgi:DNA repair exonuclease SbcCD ATPase subunit
MMTDLHLTDNPADEYRWDCFDAVVQERPELLFILGDLGDKKDRHSSKLVNRLVPQLKLLVKRGCEIYILMGNHDAATPGSVPFWSFLNEIPMVHFITSPTACGEIVLLPWTADPAEDWNLIDFNLYKCAMMHETVSGVDIGGGRTLTKTDPFRFPPHLIVYSGDIHIPQDVGQVRYVGTPHPVKYGDSHHNRLLKLRDDYSSTEIRLSPPQKRVIVLSDTMELNHLNVMRGDQVKIRFTIPASRIEQWPVEQEAIRQWAQHRGIEIGKIEVTVETGPKSESDPATGWLFADPVETLIAYCNEEGIDENHLVAGYELLDTRLATHGSETNTHVATNVGMRSLTLEYIGIEDFLSFRGMNEIILTTEPGLKYVSGTNKVEPQLGSNGAGKTSMWSALKWCWFGVSLSNKRAGQVASWGTKRPRVISGFTIDGEFHTIERLGSPNKLFLDGIECEQATVERLIGLSDSRFIHSVMFGQAAKMFYGLDIPQRGKLFDDICNLQLWMDLSDDAGNASKTISGSLARIENEITYNNGFIQGNNNRFEDARRAFDLWEQQKQSALQKGADELTQLEAIERTDWEAIQSLDEEFATIPDMNVIRIDIDKQQKLLKEVNQHVWQLHKEMEDAEKAIHFMEETRVCPTCHQIIDDRHYQQELLRLGAIKYRLSSEIPLWEKSASGQSRKAAEASEAYQSYSRWEADLESQKRLADRTFQESKARCDQHAQSMETYASAENPHQATIDVTVAKQNDITQKLSDLNQKHQELQGELILLDYWKQGFRKVRLFIIKHNLIRLELETANAASALGLGNWKIKYSTEIETKSGTLTPGIHITSIEPGGHVNTDESGGEEQRIKLAVAIGLSTFIQNMSGINIMFSMWDEPSAWLSKEGVIQLLDCLKDYAMDHGKSLWLLDHNVEDYGEFDEIWNVERTMHGSTVKQIQ